jgi:hypothetical protein
VVSAQGPETAAAAPGKRPSRWLDRIIGVVLGLALGIGVIAVFVFESSEDTIDAARIQGLEQSGGAEGQDQGATEGTPVQVPLVRVAGGKPPASGPVRLDFKQGDTARFVVGSDSPVEIAIEGLGVTRAVDSGRTLVSFRVTRTGEFPVVVADTKIEVATLQVAGR